MKSYTVLAAVSALATQVSGHYIFQQFTYGGTKYPIGTYIRPNTNYNSPITDLASNDLRCNEGGLSGANTQTIAVTAGSSFSFTTDTPVYHNGPIAIYLGKAPSTAASWDGSGQAWFKIWEKGPTFNPVTWPLSDVYTASLPAALPAGEYLLRIEQLGLHNPLPNLPQFYIACAQIRVTSGGSGTPGPLVSIPGHVKSTDPGYTVNIYNNFNSYTFVGPAVWTGGNVVTPTTTRGATTLVTTTTRAATTTTSRAGVTTTTTARATTTTTTSGGGGGTVPKYGQCGGQGWTGGTVCAAGSTCTRSNDFYSQCL